MRYPSATIIVPAEVHPPTEEEIGQFVQAIREFTKPNEWLGDPRDAVRRRAMILVGEKRVQIQGALRRLVARALHAAEPECIRSLLGIARDIAERVMTMMPDPLKDADTANSMDTTALLLQIAARLEQNGVPSIASALQKIATQPH